MFGYTIIKTSELAHINMERRSFEKMANRFQQERDDARLKIKSMTSGFRQNRKRETV